MKDINAQWQIIAFVAIVFIGSALYRIAKAIMLLAETIAKVA